MLHLHECYIMNQALFFVFIKGEILYCGMELSFKKRRDKGQIVLKCLASE